MSIGLCLLLNSVVLLWLRVGFALQLWGYGVGVLFGLLGLLVLRGAAGRFEDRGMLLIVASAIGISIYTLLNLVLFHLHEPVLERGVNVALFSLVIGASGWRYEEIRQRVARTRTNRKWTAAPLWLAFLLALGTCYGFMNNLEQRTLSLSDPMPHSIRWQDELPRKYTEALREEARPPNWGAPLDKIKHLTELSIELEVYGLPYERLAHRGLSSFLVSLAGLSGDFDLARVVAVFKIYSFYFWFSIFYLVCYVGREIFSLADGGQWALLVSAAFFGSVNFPPYTLEYSSYHGLLGATSLGMYHNSTQLFSVFVGFSGISVYLSFLKRGTPVFLIAAGLIAASFYIKPSLFTVMAPTVFLLAPLHSDKRARDLWLGLGVLLLVPLSWSLYTRVFDLAAVQVDPVINPLYVPLRMAAVRFAPEFASHTLLMVVLIFGLSFLLLFPVSLGAWRGRSGGAADFRRAPLAWLVARRVEIFFVIAFLVGVIPPIFLIEGNLRSFHGNFGWGGQIGCFLMMQLLVASMWKLPKGGLRNVALVCWALHLWGGGLHYLLFVFHRQVL